MLCKYVLGHPVDCSTPRPYSITTRVHALKSSESSAVSLYFLPLCRRAESASVPSDHVEEIHFPDIEAVFYQSALSFLVISPAHPLVLRYVTQQNLSRL
jgi:hypothetical protein